MNPLASTFMGILPAALAGLVGAFVPRRDSKGERVAIALVAALAVLLLVISLVVLLGIGGIRRYATRHDR